MKAEPPGEPAKLEAIEEQMVALLVSIGMPASEAVHRLNLWRSQQHDLEGQALEALFPALSADQQEQLSLAWALEGLAITDNLRAGAAALEIDLPQ